MITRIEIRRLDTGWEVAIYEDSLIRDFGDGLIGMSVVVTRFDTFHRAVTFAYDLAPAEGFPPSTEP